MWISSKVSNVLLNSFYPSYLNGSLYLPAKELVLHFESTRWSPCFSPLPNIWEVIQCISFNGKLFSGLILSFIRIKLDFFFSDVPVLASSNRVPVPDVEIAHKVSCAIIEHM